MLSELRERVDTATPALLRLIGAGLLATLFLRWSLVGAFGSVARRNGWQVGVESLRNSARLGFLQIARGSADWSLVQQPVIASGLCAVLALALAILGPRGWRESSGWRALTALSLGALGAGSICLTLTELGVLGAGSAFSLVLGFLSFGPGAGAAVAHLVGGHAGTARGLVLISGLAALLLAAPYAQPGPALSLLLATAAAFLAASPSERSVDEPPLS